MFEVSLRDKTCIITGASQGIGRAIALTLAQAELKGMTIIDIKKDENSEDTIKEIEKMGTEVKFVIGDVSSEDTVKEAIQVTMDTWGKIDILVNNAGIANMCDLENTTPEMWDRVLNVNLRSVFLTMKYCTEVMKKQGYGSIVNMSSISGVTGGSTGPEYGASKAGIIALTKYSAKLLGPDNIRVNAVAPGTIATDMIKRNYSKLTPEQLEKKLATIPMKRMGDPEEVGKAVLFLASDMGSYVSGDVLMVTGSRMS
ncbi:MAG: SDR family oxidoreductase [Lachnospiraceae bacterium]|nr:SDR family oxidoreductase [Lachnospiraceae bacterium]